MPQAHGFDPFSTAYWPEAPQPRSKLLGPNADENSRIGIVGALGVTRTLSTAPTAMLSSTAQAALFTKLPPQPKAQAQPQPPPADVLRALRPDTLSTAREAIRENSELSKASLEEILHKRVAGLTRAEAKLVLGALAEPVCKGRSRVWKLRE